MEIILSGGKIKELTMTQPDDMHLHVRDDEMLRAVIPHTARAVGRAIIMPNLKPPVTTTALALEYRERIMSELPKGSNFEPLMTLYLTDNTTSEEIQRASESGNIHGVKYYPAGATTNSDSGVTNIEKCHAVLQTMQDVSMPLLLHGEVTDQDVDIFDREAVFIDRTLRPLVGMFPGLRVVLEHITTTEGVEFVAEAGPNVAATITAHHMMYNRNAIFEKGINPHKYCLPVLKREMHRQALVRAATSGSPKFFFGSDSAPHARHTKEASCGCAGCYTAHAAIEFCAEVFEEAGNLDMLEGFTSHFGADFYGLPRNEKKVTLIWDPWWVPATYAVGDSDTIVPLRAGELVQWRLLG